MPTYNLYLREVIDKLLPNVVMPYYRELMAGMGQMHDYNWWRPISQVIPANDWKHEFRNKKSLAPWLEMEEGNDYPEEKFEFGDTVEMELAKWGKSFMITEEYLRFGDNRARLWPNLKDWLYEFVDAAFRRISKMHYAILLDAFNGTYYVDGLDGKALCATDHVGPDGSAVSNMITTALSVAALKEIKGLCTQYLSPHNDPITISFDTLIVAEDDEIAAWEILNTLGEVGTANNTKNYFYRRIKQVIECPALRTEMQTGANKYFFALDSNRTPIKTLMHEGPGLRWKEMEDGDSVKCLGRMYTYADWPIHTGIFGSNGTT